MTDPTLSIPSCAVIIPALNEAGNIRQLVEEVRRTVAAQVIVADNGSTDATAAEAHAGEARVVSEPRRGYGYACAAGFQAAVALGAEIVVFLDGDYSFLPAELPAVLAPVLEEARRSVPGVALARPYRARRHAPAAALWQLAGGPADEPLVRPPDHRPGAVPGHSDGSAAETRYAGDDVWLADGDDGQDRPARRTHRRGAGEFSQPAGQVEGQRHGAGHRIGWRYILGVTLRYARK